ncbi:MAG: hypothetical protein ACOC14_03875 [Bacillota bacterium]
MPLQVAVPQDSGFKALLCTLVLQPVVMVGIISTVIVLFIGLLINIIPSLLDPRLTMGSDKKEPNA